MERGKAPPTLRTVGRRRPALNGRAVAGGLLMAAAAVLVFSAWLATSGRGRPWVVTRSALAAGTTLTPGDLTTADMTLPASTAAGSFSAPSALVGRTLQAPLGAGELVQTAALVPAGSQPRLRPVAVSVDPTEASALLTGGLVDVLVTNGSSPAAPTTVVARGATVISVQQPGGSLAASANGAVVTLGVSSFAEAAAIVHAEHTGTLSVIVGEPSDGSGLGPPASAGGSGSSAGG